VEAYQGGSSTFSDLLLCEASAAVFAPQGKSSVLSVKGQVIVSILHELLEPCHRKRSPVNLNLLIVFLGGYKFFYSHGSTPPEKQYPTILKFAHQDRTAGGKSTS
jgi:hypothetical protein